MPHPRSSMAWRTSRDAMKSSEPSASATARKCSRSRPAPTPAPRRSSSTGALITAPTRAKCWPSISRRARLRGATSIPNGTSRSIRRPPSPAIASSSAGATSSCMRSIARRARRHGPSRRARASIPRRWWPATASTSAATTASSTSSTWRRARACSSSRRAGRCPRRRRLRPDGSSSGHRTASCSASGCVSSSCQFPAAPFPAHQFPHFTSESRRGVRSAGDRASCSPTRPRSCARSPAPRRRPTLHRSAVMAEVSARRR